jgi:hypothetical protein
MKQDRIKVGEPFKNDLDEFNDLIFDSGHVEGIAVLKKFTREWKHRRICKNKHINPGHTSDECKSMVTPK